MKGEVLSSFSSPYKEIQKRRRSLGSNSKLNKASSEKAFCFYDKLLKADAAKSEYAYVIKKTGSSRNLTSLSYSEKQLKPTIALKLFDEFDCSDINLNTRQRRKSFDYHDLWKSDSSLHPVKVDIDISPVKSDKAESSPDKSEPADVKSPLSIQRMEDEYPPTITDYLLQNTNGSVMRPTAFKPVKPSGMVPQNKAPNFTSDIDDGYTSRENFPRAWSRSQSSRSSTADHREAEYPPSYHSPGSQSNGITAVPVTHYPPQQAPRPSPSVSGYSSNGYFNASKITNLLQEKEAELKTLRERMDTNEQAILRAYKQSREEWRSQMNEIAQEYHRRLLGQQDSFHRTENDLHKRIDKLTMDNNQLKVQAKDRQSDRLSNGEELKFLTREVSRLRDQGDQTTRKLKQVTCECDILRKQNAELTKQNEQVKHSQDNSPQVTDLEKQLMESRKDHDALKRKLEESENDLKSSQEEHRKEWLKWKDEKELVLRYQKQLQAKYCDAYRRNSDLEQQLCRINSRQQDNSPDQVYSSRVVIASESPLPESFC